MVISTIPKLLISFNNLLISSSFKPIIANIEPVPIGVALCIYSPLFLTNFTASSNLIEELATNAEYSPKLCPATKTGIILNFCSNLNKITLIVRIAG